MIVTRACRLSRAILGVGSGMIHPLFLSGFVSERLREPNVRRCYSVTPIACRMRAGVMGNSVMRTLRLDGWRSPALPTPARRAVPYAPHAVGWPGLGTSTRTVSILERRRLSACDSPGSSCSAFALLVELIALCGEPSDALDTAPCVCPQCEQGGSPHHILNRGVAKHRHLCRSPGPPPHPLCERIGRWPMPRGSTLADTKIGPPVASILEATSLKVSRLSAATLVAKTPSA